MSERIENIGRRDVAWSYASAIFMVGAGVILMPFILHKMSAETVYLWTLFQSINALVLLLDFGFRPSFARNISYIFSGVKQLKEEGVERVNASEADVDYSLLRSSLSAMRTFYRWMALAVLALLATAGTGYFLYILQKYSGNHPDAVAAWVLLILINCYNLYTFYYDALLTGKGYIKRSQQIAILGQSIYMGAAIGLIYAGFGLSAIVGAQLISTLIRRILTYRVFFTRELKAKLSEAESGNGQSPKEVLRAISPNAIKIGLTGLGGFLVTKSAILLGGLYIPLATMACYGITVQVMDILIRCSEVFYWSYSPKLAQCRTEGNLTQLRHYYLYSIGSLVVVFILGGICWILLGDWALDLIGSDTRFVSVPMLIAMLIINLLEHNHSVSAGFIMADNKIPFFIPSLVSGAATILLLWLFLGPLQWGVWGLILAPGIAQLAYQNWKWPSVVIRELKHA